MKESPDVSDIPVEQSPKPTTPNPPPKTSGEPELEPELEPTTEQRGPTTANREELTKHNKPTHPNEYAMHHDHNAQRSHQHG